MRSHTRYLTMNVPARMEFVNITGEVEETVRDSAVREGLSRIADGRASDSYPDDLVRLCLKALGVEPRLVTEVMQFPLPEFRVRAARPGPRLRRRGLDR